MIFGQHGVDHVELKIQILLDYINHTTILDFNIIGVSLDRTKEQWEQAVEDDNLPWTQMYQILNFWNDPIARRYSIRAIPQSYFIR